MMKVVITAEPFPSSFDSCAKKGFSLQRENRRIDGYDVRGSGLIDKSRRRLGAKTCVLQFNDEAPQLKPIGDNIRV